MKILNLDFSSTGNTGKVADHIAATVEPLGCQIDAVKITGDTDLDLVSYDFIFVGSGSINGCPARVYRNSLPARLAYYAAAGEVKYASPRRANKKVVVY